MNIGEKIDDLFDTRERYYAAKRNMDEIHAELKEKEEKIMETMADNGLDKASGTKATVSLSETTIAHVQDWDKVYNFILRNKTFHLLQKRVTDAAYRELLKLRKGRRVPGIESFIKKGINLRRR